MLSPAIHAVIFKLLSSVNAAAFQSAGIVAMHESKASQIAAPKASRAERKRYARDARKHKART